MVSGAMAVVSTLAIVLSAVTGMDVEYVMASVTAVILLRLSNMAIDRWHASRNKHVPTDIRVQWAHANAFAKQFGGEIASMNEQTEAKCVDSLYPERTRLAIQTEPSTAGVLSALDGADAHETSEPDQVAIAASLHDHASKLRLKQKSTRRKRKVDGEQQCAVKMVKFTSPVVQAVDSTGKVARQKARAAADRKAPMAAKHHRYHPYPTLIGIYQCVRVQPQPA